nr:hypothetical protein Iba_chr13eCG2650 [Ipomoea batatas]
MHSTFCLQSEKENEEDAGKQGCLKVDLYDPNSLQRVSVRVATIGAITRVVLFTGSAESSDVLAKCCGFLNLNLVKQVKWNLKKFSSNSRGNDSPVELKGTIAGDSSQFSCHQNLEYLHLIRAKDERKIRALEMESAAGPRKE